MDNMNIKITRKNIKNMYIRVKPPNGDVFVSAPNHISQSEIDEFISSHIDWIEDKRRDILNGKIKAPLKYNTGDTVYLWGEEFKLQLVKQNPLKKVLVDWDEHVIYMQISKKTSIKKREKTLYDFYKEELYKKLPSLLDKCTKIVGESPRDVKVRKMKNWGNCNQNREITLNSKLASKDLKCVEYVLIHELCHLIEFNHSPDFKKLMDKYCPDWRSLKKRLNE